MTEGEKKRTRGEEWGTAGLMKMGGSSKNRLQRSNQRLGKDEKIIAEAKDDRFIRAFVSTEYTGGGRGGGKVHDLGRVKPIWLGGSMKYVIVGLFGILYS